MHEQRLLALARPWLSRQLGFDLPASPRSGRTNVVRGLPDQPGRLPLFAVRADNVVAVSVRPEWEGPVQRLVEDLHPDMVFSIFGSFELSRITLPGDVAVWGNVPNYLADGTNWRPAKDPRPVLLTHQQLDEVNREVFWHCNLKDPVAAYGVYESGELVALASVADHGDSMLEIGVDAAPQAKSRGLGRAVVSAAGDWILEHGGIIHATAGPWNVPSTRTLRSLGMQYAFSTMIGRPAPFKVPPQPLGKPLPDAEVFDLYPGWSLNSDIRPAEEA